jgi:hypothetical protein
LPEELRGIAVTGPVAIYVERARAAPSAESTDDPMRSP